MSVLKFRECKAVLFDFGGTLDSDGEHWLDRVFALYERAGLDLPPSEIKRAFYYADSECTNDSQVALLGLRPLMRHHVHLQFKALNLDKGREEKEFVETFCSQTEQFLQRSVRLLTRMRQRFRLGLVSNFYGNLTVLCREAGLSDFLDVILDSTQVGISKPDPGIFRMALDKLELSPGKVIFVGDSYERDMIPSRELGMKTIWLKGPNPRMPLNAGPVDASISSLFELERLVS